MSSIIELIKEKNAEAIVNYCKALTPEQRWDTISDLKKPEHQYELFGEEPPKWDDPNREAFYTNWSRLRSYYCFAFVACTRSWADYKKTEYKKDGWTVNPLKELLFGSVEAPLVSFFISFPPDYLDRVVQEMRTEKTRIIDFNTLWKCYEHGWVKFDEAYFTRSLFTIQMFDRNTGTDAELLLTNRRIFEEVFLRFYRNEIPILDISKWQAREGFVCKKVYEYWTEVIVLLQEKGHVFERSIIANLIESLLNNWKKGHLDWHIRLIDLFKPTKEELLQHQHLLFSLLGTNNPSLINFSVRRIKEIHTSSDFNGVSFVESFALCFSNEKCVKAILSGLDMVETVLSQPGHQDIEFAEQLAVLFIHPDIKLQQKVAWILLRFSNAQRISQVTEPYLTYLKQATKQQLLLSMEKKKEEPEIVVVQQKTEDELKIPSTWDELLFQIGQCIRTKSSTDIDLFLEGVNYLQDQVPGDLEKQLKPYTKQLFNRPWDSDVMAYFTFFLEGWLTKTAIVIEDERRSAIPFLKNKCNWVLKKLTDHNTLPLLSTPSHAPFFIHPTILIQRVLMYEKQNAHIDYEDLIVACNRTWHCRSDEETKILAGQLEGMYAKVLCYYMGVSERVEVTVDQLALWSQVTRIKHPDKIFHEFEKTEVRDYPSVVHPLKMNFKIEVEVHPQITWYKLLLDGNWNRAWYDEYKLGREYKAEDFDQLYYNLSTLKKAVREDIPYQLSLNPGYVDGQLARYIPRLATGNEVTQQEDCLYPMQFLLDNEIELDHSGWIYVATCLIFEKKLARDLAGEYVKLSLIKQGKELDYLADTLGKLIAFKYAPVNRLIEFLDRPESERKVNLFQLHVLEKCIEYFNVQQLPVNSKKIIEYYKEWMQRLAMPGQDRLQEKIESIKKK